MDVDIGVTATRRGLTKVQLRSAEQGFGDMKDAADGRLILRHGCCVGGDEELHHLARAAGFWIVGHPPVDTRWMARDLDCDEWFDPAPYLDRNTVMVHRSTTMWCYPGEVTERTRGSGTWHTIRYAAINLRMEGSIIYPDGTILGLEDWRLLR